MKVGIGIRPLVAVCTMGLTLAFAAPAWAGGGNGGPTNTVPPTLEGSPVVGQTLTVNNGTWNPIPTYYTYSWELCPGEGACENFSFHEPHINTQSYKPVAADVGHKLRAIVAAWDSINRFTWTQTPEVGPVTEAAVSGSVVNAKPTGPSEPASGWHVAYAEGFGLPLGSGEGKDPQWVLEEGANCCTNSNEVAAVQKSQVKVGTGGIELDCTRKDVEVQGVKQKYTCAEALNDPSFEYTYGQQQTIVVEWVGQFPPNTGGADPAVWSYTSNEEIDYLEGFGWDGTGWTVDGVLPAFTHHSQNYISNMQSAFGFDPSAGIHRYTTKMEPAGSEYLVSEYVDGALQHSFLTGINESKDGLILVNELRKGATEPTYTGTHTFTVRSVAVYQDGAHAGQGIKGGGVAPGTTVK